MSDARGQVTDVDEQGAELSAGRRRFLEMIRFLESVDEYRGDGATPDDVLDAFPELADVEVTDLTIDGPGGPLPARLYRPGGPATPSAPAAALVWVHGGAFVMGTLDMAESHAVGLGLAHRGVPVLALDYRKALHGVRHPAPVDDVAAGWAWAVEHADRLGVAPADLHLGGASAGGTLVTAVAQRLRDDGGPVPASLVLAYTSQHGGPVVDEPEMARLREIAPDDLFEEDFMRALVEHYAGGAARDPDAFPGYGDPAGLPPALVLDCEIDTLRFSSEAWVRAVAEAGGHVVVEQYAGATHGVLDRPTSEHGRAMLARMADWLTGPTPG